MTAHDAANEAGAIEWDGALMSALTDIVRFFGLSMIDHLLDQGPPFGAQIYNDIRVSRTLLEDAGISIRADNASEEFRIRTIWNIETRKSTHSILYLGTEDFQKINWPDHDSP